VAVYILAFAAVISKEMSGVEMSFNGYLIHLAS
jgi:hypothetical protein